MSGAASSPAPTPAPPTPAPGRSPRLVAFWTLLAVYLIITLLVIFDSPLIDLDRALYDLHLHVVHPSATKPVVWWELFGQRGPATIVSLPFFAWICWRTRSLRPLVMLLTALVLLNLSVGVVKVVVSRLAPQQSRFAHEVFMGGNIYPSGHVSNVVVLYGLLAWISLRHRPAVAAAAVFLVVTVSAGTIYLNTHWFSDLIGGVLAGALVLLVLPSAMPTTQRWAEDLVGRLGRRWRWVRRLDPTSRDDPADDAARADDQRVTSTRPPATVA